MYEIFDFVNHHWVFDASKMDSHTKIRQYSSKLDQANQPNFNDIIKGTKWLHHGTLVA